MSLKKPDHFLQKRAPAPALLTPASKADLSARRECFESICGTAKQMVKNFRGALDVIQKRGGSRKSAAIKLAPVFLASYGLMKSLLDECLPTTYTDTQPKLKAMRQEFDEMEMPEEIDDEVERRSSFATETPLKDDPYAMAPPSEQRTSGHEYAWNRNLNDERAKERIARSRRVRLI